MTSRANTGFTLVELLLALALGALVMLGLQRSLIMSASVSEQVNDGIALDRSVRFAFDRVVQNLRNTSELVLPLPDDPGTDWREDIRSESVPASPPTGSSSKDTAVLAMALPFTVDSNNDGFADADNDQDGRLNEDWPADSTNDNASGLVGIDDDGDGLVDEEADTESDDEAGPANDDPHNSVDDNGNGFADEDPGNDMNGDGAPGRASVDDDGDGLIDEGGLNDDDEDGPADEDWLDTVVYYLNGDELIERRSVPWDASGDGSIDGKDYVTSVVASGVSYFSVQRLRPRIGGRLLVEVQLDLVDATGRTVSLRSRVRVARAGGRRS